MKFSVAAISALVLSTAVSFTTADSYSDAMKSWCSGKCNIFIVMNTIDTQLLGLDVTFPTASTVVGAGSKTKVTVSKYIEK
jgi:hypothetical protein